MTKERTFIQFAKLAQSHGLMAIDRGNGHWQVKGKLTVNYYPFGKRGPTFYINGRSRAFEQGTFKQAIRAAIDEPRDLPKSLKEPRMSSGRSLSAKRRLYRMNPHCRWCGIYLEWKDATLEHVIPLHRGGSNRFDNLSIACNPCNQKRGNHMPELKGEPHVKV